jgi:hypothetical protein
MLHCYQNTTQAKGDASMSSVDERSSADLVVERVQIGARMEKRLVKVLRALADYHDLSLGDLLEGIVLHVFDGRLPFDETSMQRIAKLKEVYGVTIDARASHHLTENNSPSHEEMIP